MAFKAFVAVTAVVAEVAVAALPLILIPKTPPGMFKSSGRIVLLLIFAEVTALSAK